MPRKRAGASVEHNPAKRQRQAAVCTRAVDTSKKSRGDARNAAGQDWTKRFTAQLSATATASGQIIGDDTSLQTETLQGNTSSTYQNCLTIDQSDIIIAESGGNPRTDSNQYANNEQDVVEKTTHSNAWAKTANPSDSSNNTLSNTCVCGEPYDTISSMELTKLAEALRTVLQVPPRAVKEYRGL